MADVVKVENKTRRYPYYWYDTCYTPYRAFRNTTGFRTVKAYNNRQSRQKPDDLISAMTPQSIQYTLRQSAASRTERRSRPCYATSPPSMFYEYWRNDSILSIAEPVPDPNWALDLRQKISDLRLDLSGFVAEFDETASSVVSAARTLRRAYQQARGRMRRRRLTRCSVGSANLALSFGIMPAVNDVFQSYIKLKERLDQEILVKVKSFTTDNGTERLSIQDWKGTQSWSSSASAVAYIVLDNNYLTTIGNPLRWAWERVPFSFAVDYVYDIGGYLQAVDPIQGLTLKGCSVTFKKKYTLELERTSLGLGSNYEEVESIPQIEDYHSHERRTYTSIPLPRPPGISTRASVRRIANALSVIQGLTTNNCRNR